MVEDGETLFVKEYEDGTIYYTNYKEQYHRRKGPAVIWTSKSTSGGAGESWYFDGILHRETGPAFIIYGKSTRNEYYLHGEKLTKKEFYKRLLKSRIQKLYESNTVIDT